MRIPLKEHENVMSSFWTMLKECESVAHDKNDAVLKHWVDAWFRQWNGLTGQNHKSIWQD